VALAAIQGLYEIVQEKNCEIEELSSEISNLKSHIAELKAMVQSLTENQYRDSHGAVRKNGGGQ